MEVEYSNSQSAPLIKNQIKQYTVNKAQIKITKKAFKEKQDQCLKHCRLVILVSSYQSNIFWIESKLTPLTGEEIDSRI